jgi:Tfp pilus assembly protein PilN
MTQQINLFIPILLTQKRYFSAQAMALALAVFVLSGGALCGFWVWSLNGAGDMLKTTLASQTPELTRLQAALQANKTQAAPSQLGLTQQLQTQKTALSQREDLLKELTQGLSKPGFGHAARLQLLAQTIPARAWITEIKADDGQLAVSGFTQDPAALNDWVAKLEASPLLKGQKLETFKVVNADASVPAASRPAWAFSLLSAVDKTSAATGGRP